MGGGGRAGRQEAVRQREWRPLAAATCVLVLFLSITAQGLQVSSAGTTSSLLFLKSRFLLCA